MFRGKIWFYTFVYLLCGLGWILVSDRLVVYFSDTDETLIRYQFLKGSAFVLGTGICVFFMLVAFSRRVAGQREILRAFAENSRDVIFRYRLQPAERFEYVSPACFQMTGHLPDDFFANPGLFREMVHPEDRALLDWETFDESSPLLIRTIHRNGDTVWTEIQRHFIRDTGGVPQIVEGIARNVTDRMDAWMRFEGIEARYRETVRSLPFPLLLYGADLSLKFTNEAGQVLLADEGSGAAPGDPWWESEPYRRVLSECARSREVVSTELPYRKNESSKYYFVSAAPLFYDREEREKEILVVLIDISRRKELEERLNMTARLATLGEMSAGLAHEINQPLQIMKLSLEMLAEALDEGVPEVDFLRKQSVSVRKNLDRVTRISDNLRLFARKDAAARECVDLRKVLDSARELVEGRLRKAGVRWNQVLPAGLPRTEGSPGQLEQVFVNILINAVDALVMAATPQPTVSVNGFEKVEGIVIEIFNNGPWIAKALMFRIFEPFFTTKAPGSGTGLGLSISFGIVQAHGGTLTAANRDEGGVVFRVELPAVAC